MHTLTHAYIHEYIHNRKKGGVKVVYLKFECGGESFISSSNFPPHPVIINVMQRHLLFLILILIWKWIWKYENELIHWFDLTWHEELNFQIQYLSIYCIILQDTCNTKGDELIKIQKRGNFSTFQYYLNPLRPSNKY